MSISDSGKIGWDPSITPVSTPVVKQVQPSEQKKEEPVTPAGNETRDTALLSQAPIPAKAPEKKEAPPKPKKQAPDPLALAVADCNKEGALPGKIEMTSTGALMMMENPPPADTTKAPSEAQKSDSDSKISFTILHTNDIHGFLTEKEGDGSFSEIAQKAKEINKQQENVLFLDAGDSTEGTHSTNDQKGKPMVEAMDVLNQELMTQDKTARRGGNSPKLISTIGNHEGMFGADQLKQNIAKSKHPTVVCNLADKEGNPLKNTKPFELVTFKDKKGNQVRVAIVGVTTPETGKNKDLTVKDPVQSVKDAARAAREAGADTVIVLSHCGQEKDKEIAKECGDVSAIVGGHSHDRITDPVKVNNAVIVQAGSNAQDLGQLDLTFDTKTKKVLLDEAQHKLIPIDKTMPNDPRVEVVARKYERAKKEEEYNKKIGHLDEPLAVPREDSGVETRLGNAFADKIRKEGGADIAVYNKGSLRAKLGAGDVTQRQCDNVFHYKDKIVTVKMKGRDVSDLMEKSFADRPHGGVYCTSGMKVEYDPTALKGEKVKKIQLEKTGPDGKVYYEDLDPEKEYTLATLTYIASLQGLKGTEHGTAKEAFDTMMKETMTNKRVFNVSTDRLKDVSENRPEMNEKVGSTIYPLISPVDQVETNLGNYMADAVRKMAVSSLSLVDKDAIREGIDAGDITRRSLFYAFPFDDHVLSAEFTGSEIQSILERNITREEGGIFALSGMKMQYDPGAPEGARVREVSMNGEKLDSGKTYRLGFTDHMRETLEGMDRGRNVVDHGMLRKLLVSDVKKSLEDPGYMNVACNRIENVGAQTMMA